MSVRDIILDRVKDKLYQDLRGSLRDRIYNVQPPLEKWNVEYVSDFIDLIIENDESNIKRIINRNITENRLTLGNLDDSTIDDIVKEIKSSKLVLNSKPIAVWTPATTNKTTFPFSARSLLQMCWGLTLNFSHNTQQQAVGAMFNAKFNDQHNLILAPNLAKNLSDANSDFLMNLEMAFSSSLRNLGFIRDNHTEYLTFNGDRLAGRRQNLENIADFASFSGSGLFAKLGSFIGFGSLSDLLSKTNLSLVWLPFFIVGGIFGGLQ